MLAGMGLRGWRQNAENITGKPDVAFDNLRIAVFVDGCFWHGCPYCKRKLPATNRGYWKHKINRNKELAKSHTAKLRRGGWIVIRIWEHEIRPNQGLDRIRIKLAKALGFRGF
jgi:DNA mismatch endonuclease, patch repair protein